MLKRFVLCLAIVVSVVGCGGDAATEAENEMLRTQLENERLRAQLQNQQANTGEDTVHNTPVQQAPANVAGANSANVMQSPEDVVRAYLNARVWQDRLAFVVLPNRVEPLMRARYSGVDLVSTMANSEVRPAREQGAGKWHVPVTVDGFSSNMVVIKTQGGNKIDWEASMSLVQADFEKSEEVQTAAFIKRWGLENAKLEIKVLKVYQKFSFTYFDLEVRNRSDAFLDFWGLVGVIYDSGDKYLGKSITNGKNLTPGDTAFVSIRFSDVNYATVKSWKFTLSDIDLSNDSGENVDAIQHFSIIVR